MMYIYKECIYRERCIHNCMCSCIGTYTISEDIRPLLPPSETREFDDGTIRWFDGSPPFGIIPISRCPHILISTAPPYPHISHLILTPPSENIFPPIRHYPHIPTSPYPLTPIPPYPPSYIIKLPHIWNHPPPSDIIPTSPYPTMPILPCPHIPISPIWY